MPRNFNASSSDSGVNVPKKRFVIFVSGSGSNAEKIMEYFSKNREAEVTAILSNNRKSPLPAKALQFHVPSFCFNREDLYESGQVEQLLDNLKPDLLVLAGFLWLMPSGLVKKYSGRILNLHPALLPKFGGKGMFGMKVHEAVISAGEKHSGITIHLIDDEYDKGNIVFQEKVEVKNLDAAGLQKAVQKLEHRHFAEVIAKYLKKI